MLRLPRRASYADYLLASQDRRSVKVYTRDDAGRWSAEAGSYLRGQSFALPMLKSPIAVDEIYEGILDQDGRSLLR